MRGGEVQTSLKKSDLEFRVDEEVKEFVTLGTAFMTKNHQGGATSCGRDEAVTCGHIQDPTQVKALKRLVEKLNPEINRLFPRALPAVKDPDQPCWFAASGEEHA